MGDVHVVPLVVRPRWRRALRVPKFVWWYRCAGVSWRDAIWLAIDDVRFLPRG